MVIGKTAWVVEEVRVGKEATEHAERVHDSVRKTDVEVEVAAGTAAPTANTTTLAESGRAVRRGGL